MLARFWGTRGSIPVSLTAQDVRRKIAAAIRGIRAIRGSGRLPETDADVERCLDELGFETAGTYGGHSSCVEIEAGEDRVLCDLGSGAWAFGQAMLGRFGPARPQTYHVFLSHVHWDHIMGFPFFAPSYIPGNRIVIHGCHAELEAAFRRQHGAPSFPVDFDALGAAIEFDVIPPGETREIAGFKVRAMKQRHAGDSYGWRFERGGRAIVYSTDSEHRLEDAAEMTAFAKFFRDADLVIFDAMYSLAEAVTVKADWGHSSNVAGVELCQMAGARRLCLFHHEPAFDDARIESVLAETRRFEEITRTGGRLEVIAAWDGLEVKL